MIELRDIDHRNVPLLICDVCHEPITDTSMAMVKYPKLRENGATTRLIVMCHKLACDKKSGGDRLEEGWQELGHFLARLLVNAGMDLASVKKAMEGMERMQTLG